MPLRKNKEMKVICCVAGRSAGHIVPALTRVHSLLEKEPDQEAPLGSQSIRNPLSPGHLQILARG